MPSSTAVFRAVADFASLNRAVRGVRKELAGLEKDMAKANSTSSDLDKAFGRLSASQDKLAGSSDRLSKSQDKVNKSFKDSSANIEKSANASSRANKNLQTDLSKTTRALSDLAKAERAASSAGNSHVKTLENEKKSASSKSGILKTLVSNMEKLSTAERAASTGARSHATALDKEGSSARAATDNKKQLTKATSDVAKETEKSVSSQDAFAKAMQRLASDVGMTHGELSNYVKTHKEVDAATTKSASSQGAFARAMGKSTPEVDKSSTALTRLRAALKGSGADSDSSASGLERLGAGLLGFSEKSAGAMRAGTALRVVLYGLVAAGVGPAIQLVVGGLSALAGGAGAVVAAASPMVGIFAALPTSLLAFGGALATVKIAMGGLDKPMNLLGKALTGGAEDAAKFQKSLAGLPAPAQAFLKSIFALKPALDQVRVAAQNSLFPGLTAALKILAPLLTSVALPAVKAFGTALGGLAVDAAKAIAGLQGPLTEFFTGAGPKLVTTFGEALISLGAAFVQVGIAAAPFTQWLADTVKGWADYAKAVTEGEAGTQRVQAFLESTKAALQLFGSTLKSVGDLLVTVFSGPGAQLGRDLVTEFRDATQAKADFFKTDAGQAQLKTYFEQLRPNIEIIARIFGKLGAALIQSGASTTLTTLLTQIETKLVPAIERFSTAFGKAMETVGPKIIDLFTNIIDIFTNLMNLGEGGFLSAFIDILSSLAAVLKTLTSIPGIAQLIASLLALAGAMAAIKAIGTLTGLSKVARGINALAGGQGAVTAATKKGRATGPKTAIGGFAQGVTGNKKGKEAPRTGTARAGNFVGSKLRGAKVAGGLDTGKQATGSLAGAKAAGALATAYDRVTESAARAGSAVGRVGPAAGKAVSAAGQEIVKNYNAGADAAAKFGDTATKASVQSSENLTKKLSGAIDKTSTKFTALPRTIDNVGLAAASMSEKVNTTLNKIGSGQSFDVGKKIATGISKGMDVAESATTKGVNGIVKGFDALDKASNGVVAGVTKGFNGLDSATKSVVSGVSRGFDTLDRAADSVASGLGRGLDAAEKVVTAGVNKIVQAPQAVSAGFAKIKDLGTRAFTGLETGITKSISVVNSSMDSLEKGLMRGASAVANVSFDKIGGGLSKAAVNVGKGALSITNSLQNLPTTLRTLSAQAGTAMDGLPTRILASTVKASSAVTKFGTSLKTGLTTAVNGIPAIVGKVGTSLSAIATPISGAMTTVVRTVSTSLNSLKTTVGTSINSLKTTLIGGFKGIGSGIKTALGGLGGALGGPWGVAIAAATTALAIFIGKQEEAKQAALDHQAAIEGLAGTLDQFTGAVTAETVAQQASKIASATLADGHTKLTDAVSRSGISLGDFGAAATGSAPALAKVNTQIIAAAHNLPAVNTLYSQSAAAFTAAGVSQDDFYQAIAGGDATIDTMVKKLGFSVEGARAFKLSLSDATGELGQVANALAGYNSDIQASAQLARGAALGARNFGQALAAIGPALSGLEAAGAPVGVLKTNLDELGAAAQQSAQLVGDGILKAGGTAAAAAAGASKSMTQLRTDFIAAGVEAGNSEGYMNQLADSIGLIPSSAAFQFNSNAAQAVPALQKVSDTIAAIPVGTKEINIGVQDASAIATLESFGLKVKQLSDGTTVILNADDKPAVDAFQQFIALTKGQIASVQVDATVDQATGKINGLITLANGQQISLAIDADPALANGKIQGVVTLANGQVANVTIDANQVPVEGKIKAIVTLANGTRVEVPLAADDQVTPLLDKFKTNPPVIAPKVEPQTPGPIPQGEPYKPPTEPQAPGAVPQGEPYKPPTEPQAPATPVPQGEPYKPPTEPAAPTTPPPAGPPYVPATKPAAPTAPPPPPAKEPVINYTWGTPTNTITSIGSPPVVNFAWGTPTNTITANAVPTVNYAWGTPTNQIPVPQPISVAVTYTITSNVATIQAAVDALKTAIATTHTITSNAAQVLAEADKLNGHNTTSTHTITSNASQILSEIDKLNGHDTSSTHTITTVYKTQGTPPANSGGSVIPNAGGSVRPFAGGGATEEPQGYAPGGIMPGYAPGKDTIPAVLSPGEAVLVPELVKALGPKNILEANKLASGRASATKGADRARMMGQGPNFGGASPIKGIAQIIAGVTGSPLAQKFAKGGVVVGFKGGGAVKDNKKTKYKVKKGDTLWSIANKYGSTPNIIVEANKKSLGDSTSLAAGQSLTIPQYPKRPNLDTPDANTTNYTTGGYGVDDPSKFQSFDEWMASTNRSNAEQAEFERDVLQIAEWGYADLADALVQMGVGDIHSSGTTSYETGGTSSSGSSSSSGKKKKKGDTSSSADTAPATVTHTVNYTDIDDKTQSGLLLARQAVASRAKAAQMDELLKQKKGMLNEDLGLLVKIVAALQKAVGLGIREVSTATELSTDDIFKVMKKTAAKSEINKLPSANNAKFLSNLAAYEKGEAFARGGTVKGSGNRDTVPALLTPGEFVLRKGAAEAIGHPQLHRLNRADKVAKYAAGGSVTHAADLFSVMGRSGVSRPGTAALQKQLSSAVMSSSSNSSSNSAKSVVFEEGSVQITNPSPARAVDSFGHVMTKLSWSGAFS